MVKDVFPTKEAGDFLNSKFVNLKYELDIDERDSIKNRGVEAYPTFLFLDGGGMEVSRMVGATSDPKIFIERVKRAVAPENSWAVVNEAYQNDPSYAIKYITHLQNSGMRRDAKRILNELFEKRSVTDNFNSESVEYYREYIDDIRTPVIQFMLKNSKEVMAVMGEEKYKAFLIEKGNGYLADCIFSRSFKKLSAENTIRAVGIYELFHSPFYNFVCSIVNEYVDKNLDLVLKAANDFIQTADSDSRSKIAKTVVIAGQIEGKIIEEKRNEIVSFLQKCHSFEKNEKRKTEYLKQIEKL